MDDEINLSWITPQLAVGGRFRCAHVERLAGELHVNAVVDMREEACDDLVLLRDHGLSFLHLPTQDHCAVSAPMLCKGVAFVGHHLQRKGRVLIHCEHGVGRSATLALCVLVDCGWPPLEALKLAKTRRWQISPSPAQYHAWTDWLRAFADESRTGWEIPDFDAFKAVAYAHLRSELA